MCDHKYVHLNSKRKKNYNVVTGMTEWIKIDYFYCEKCLGEQEKRKSETTNMQIPEWY
jgi:predicted metal-dependent hydrolase